MSAAADFAAQRKLALEILTREPRLTRKAGSFLGQCCVDPTPLTDKQADWLGQLAERDGLELEASQ